MKFECKICILNIGKNMEKYCTNVVGRGRLCPPIPEGTTHKNMNTMQIHCKKMKIKCKIMCFKF